MPLLVRRRSALNRPLTASDDAASRSNTSSNGLLQPGLLHSPRPKSEQGQPPSRLSHELTAEDFSDDETVRDTSKARIKRFSLMKLRNFSESHLSTKAKENDGARTPPVPTMPSPAFEQPPSVPALVRTAPTMPIDASVGDGESAGQGDSAHRNVRPSLFRRSMSKSRLKPRDTPPRKSFEVSDQDTVKRASRWRMRKQTGLDDLQQLAVTHQQSAPPSYEESHSGSTLPVPTTRASESSDGSDRIYGTTTTTHTISTHTTFFKLPRRNQNRHSLFPLPLKLPPPDTERTSISGPITPRASTSAASAQASDGRALPATSLQRRYTETSPTKRLHLSALNPAVGSKPSLSFADSATRSQLESPSRSRASSNSSPLQPPMRLGARGRTSTSSSIARSFHSQDLETPPPLPGSTRNSTSTTGRSSLGGFLTLSRFRQSSEPHSPSHGSPGIKSKSNSFAISREALVIPDREEGDTPGKYLERLESTVARSMIAGVLSKSSDSFTQAVLRSYNRRFMFFGEPIDMSLRKFLLEAELPKETQQVDRVIQAFADRYHECNPGIFVSPDQAYIIAFSLMMLHTDAFNKNNKRKMQKSDYLKNTSGQQVSDDVLACFYDNICYTPFVHYEEDVDINGERVLPFKPKRSKLKGAMPDSSGKKLSGPVDPYNLLIDQKLDLLRPPIRDNIAMDDPYNYRGSSGELDPQYLQRAFTHTGVLQIISARSRPAAYEGRIGSENNTNPEETEAGIVDLKITKVGTLWRKAAKKKKARSPWQEWGAILTGSQLYLFKNAHWARGLTQQFNSQQRKGQLRSPVIFKPPLTEFKPDALIKTDNAVALTDATYTRHKHAFTFFRTGGQEEVFLADNEDEMNDWLGLINYAAAFRAAGVRIRGMVGGNEEDLRSREAARMSSLRENADLPPKSGKENAVARGTLSPQLQRQVMAARRQIMVSKISDFETEVTDSVKQLDSMLRNARHLLVLAPIALKTREDIIHAAARADANIKWVRRDIWRMKCHRDILAMDARLDGLSAAELQTLADEHAAAANARKEEAEAFDRAGSVTAQTPPQSPKPNRDNLPSTNSFERAGDDVFRTPPESRGQSDEESYQLPPLSLDIDSQRGSIASTLLSVSSPTHPSLSHASSNASGGDIKRQRSSATRETADSNPNTDGGASTSLSDERPEILARPTTTPEPFASAAKGIGIDGPTSTTTPESGTKHRSGVRRSLQKTLRDAHHTGSVNKHRRGKESESTIRFGGAEAEELINTPGLQREKGRFILHGKQASVVQFGGEWSNEHMKQRREQLRQSSTESKSEIPEGALFGEASPLVLNFNHEASATDDDGVSTDSTQSAGLRVDAHVASAYTALTASPVEEEHSDAGMPQTTRSEKRQTVIGPGVPLCSPESRSTDGEEEVRSDATGAQSDHKADNGSRGATEDEDVGSGIASPIDDDELRHITADSAPA